MEENLGITAVTGKNQPPPVTHGNHTPEKVIHEEEDIGEEPYRSYQRAWGNPWFFNRSLSEENMPFGPSEQSRSRSITPERRRGRQPRYGREEYHDLREGRDDRILSIITELQNNQRQMQERILTLMMDRNARNSEGYPEGWRTPKMTMYEGNTDPEDHIHSFHTGMEDTTKRKDI